MVNEQSDILQFITSVWTWPFVKRANQQPSQTMLSLKRLSRISDMDNSGNGRKKYFVFR